MHFKSKILASLMVLGGLGLLSLMPAAHAQVLNYGPGATQSKSDVTLKATIPSVVFVKVDETASTLAMSVAPGSLDATSNTVNQDFKIRGNVLVNSPSANVSCTVSSTALTLTNGSDSITANLSGTIGGTAISTTGFSPTFSSRQAAISIDGDVDDTTLTSAKAPGDYTGTLTITASLI